MKSGTRNVVVSLWMGYRQLYAVADDKSSRDWSACRRACGETLAESMDNVRLGCAAGARAARSTFTASKAVHDLELLPPPGSLRTTTIFVRD
jgi:ribosomal protein S27AE